MATYTWDEVIEMLNAYNRCVEADDEEGIAFYSNILPDEIRFGGAYGDEIHIVI